MEQVAAQQAAIKEATVEALEQGQAVLEVASAKQAAMHSAVEHALQQGQSALDQASARHEGVHLVVESVLQQVAVQAAVEQAVVQQAQQGQVALLDLLPAVGAPVDEAGLQQVEPLDELINLDLGF
jgi:saccharopine dehydrogenase-like NADP-dependent oxidoreductase